MKSIENIVITSDAFENNGTMPVKYTGRGEDISPSLKLSKVSSSAKSIAIIMDDLDVPVKHVYNHWVIWNIPVAEIIPENIAYGEFPINLKGAVQGRGYGKNKYRGPLPPFGSHRYKFDVFVLDCLLNLDPTSRKKQLIKAMEGHILQYGYIIGKYI